jgi:hypothetical protein
LDVLDVLLERLFMQDALPNLFFDRSYLYLLLVQSLLVAQLCQGRVHAWVHETLTTVGEACRAVLHETLGKTIFWGIEWATLDGVQGTFGAHLTLQKFSYRRNLAT